MGCIVSSHESESTKLIQAVGWRTSAWWTDMRIVYPRWDMGVRRLIVVAGNWELGLNWSMTLDGIDSRSHFDHEKNGQWQPRLTFASAFRDFGQWKYFSSSHTLPVYTVLTLFGICQHLCISLSKRESSLTFTEIESVLEAIVSNFCSSFIESDYKFTFLD